MRAAELAANKKNISELIVKSHTKNLSLIRDFISAKASVAGLCREDIENIMLAVDEACTNIIKHAYKSYPDGEIVINVEFNEEKISISIIDKGSAFNSGSVPDPDLQKYYKNGRVGGLGMYLMKTLMDDVEYISVPGAYNKVLLSKKIKVARD